MHSTKEHSKLCKTLVPEPNLQIAEVLHKKCGKSPPKGATAGVPPSILHGSVLSLNYLTTGTSRQHNVRFLGLLDEEKWLSLHK